MRLSGSVVVIVVAVTAVERIADASRSHAAVQKPVVLVIVVVLTIITITVVVTTVVDLGIAQAQWQRCASSRP
jgi:hypothetical protein